MNEETVGTDDEDDRFDAREGLMGGVDDPECPKWRSAPGEMERWFASLRGDEEEEQGEDEEEDA